MEGAEEISRSEVASSGSLDIAHHDNVADDLVEREEEGNNIIRKSINRNGNEAQINKRRMSN